MKYFLLIVVFSFIACQPSPTVNIYNHQDQIVKSYTIDQDSLIHGALQSYTDDGTLSESAQYTHGTLDGIRYIYYPSGNVEIEEKYVDGQLHGPYLQYFDSGQLQFVAQYENDVLTGTTKMYYPSGALKETVTFKDNEENGPFSEYYENGQLHWQGQYLDGDNEIGELLQYNEQGQLIKKMMCDSLHKCQTVWERI